MKITVEPIKPDLCRVTAKPTWLEKLFGVRGYTERPAALFGQTWLWDSTSRRVEPHIARAIECEYGGLWWSPAPPS